MHGLHYGSKQMKKVIDHHRGIAPRFIWSEVQ
jgi:hypothetical protein